jgi:DNA-binding CsgD family transcriptional regulator
MTTAGEAALRRVLAVADLLIDAVDEEALVPALLPPLLAALPGDSIVWAPHPAPAGPVCLPGDLIGPDALAAYERGAGADPLVAHTTTGSGVPARRSDLQSRAQCRAMRVYAEVYRPLGAEHQLAMAFPAGSASGARGRICLVVNRSSADFGDAELETAGMLRVRLAHAMARLAAGPHAVGPHAAGTLAAGPDGAVPDGDGGGLPVTRREAAVLGLLSRGLTNEQIAHRLDISPRTVDKHLEHVYPKLRVRGRVEAANAWRTVSHSL